MLEKSTNLHVVDQERVGAVEIGKAGVAAHLLVTQTEAVALDAVGIMPRQRFVVELLRPSSVERA